MKPWIYYALLIPRNEFVNNPNISKKTIGFKKFYQNFLFEFDIEKELDTNFDKLEHWSDKYKSWGNNGSKINLSFMHPLYIKNNSISRIYLEFDLRYTNTSILEKFIDLAVKLDSYIVRYNTIQSIVLEPKIEEVIKDIKNSLEFQFIINPQNYYKRFNELKAEKKK